MQEGRYKVLMYVFLGLFVISALAAGYFGLYFYYAKKIAKSYQADVINQEQELENYNNKIQENSIYGIIKSIADNKILIDIGDGQEKQINYSKDVKIQKLQEDSTNKGTYTFVEGTREDLLAGKELWIIVDEMNKDNAILIKISTP